ncbi:MAG: 50S ribosomal protein L9 [Actinomycetales bacterium]|jgi:large subunit ribosomal protein L9|uniref:Large ribosomal subunit protein bL9 n=1 Tax=Candidatus Phosphoribacter hodrii TaxID=2953743 RepID=A0A934X6S0_9MICO|nr:50S ribosomal protein L9 [Candidatus Phosphoribacter hodrii]OPZ56416.1 MAG: 50S ribosomal protein L9 [bacterium ADurb.BinA028]HNV14268.1 50S ribosomal protein L9 [Dermatophilaceae bacterium]MBK7274871.1 50S ribosomal protein L9 [Candidatus Phosphoribacter hodrii]MBL0003125.1 50S ribosomal protein L9 [Candidatus Phosphoribacter hodrii]
MKVILTHEVSGLGTAGDVVDVKDGYARNYLFPRKLGTSWTAGGQKQVDSILKARESRTIKSLDDAKAVKSRIEGTTVTLSAKAGNSGRLFGAVSGSDLAAAVVKAGGPELDKRKIEVPGHIKTVGSYVALVRLHPEVQAKLAFEVVKA